MTISPKLISKFLGGGGNAKGIGSLSKATMLFGGVEFASDMHQGDDFGKAAMKTAVDTMLWTNYAPIMGAIQAAQIIPAVGQAGYTWYQQQKQWWNTMHLQGTVGGNYQDTQKALTMRQAAIQAIQGSKLNARSALGGEAQILNQNWTRT